MDTSDQLADLRVVMGLRPDGKRQLLENLATEAASRLGRSRQDILEAVQTREKLGSTALGGGVALPHAHLDGSFRPLVLFAKLDRPIDFDARDGEPVDLFFLVLWPSDDIKGLLPATKQLCQALRAGGFLRQLRLAKSAESATQLLLGELASGRVKGAVSFKTE